MDFLKLINLKFLSNQLFLGLELFRKHCKSLAKILNPLLGMITNLHHKNSSDLLNKRNNINMENKSLASPDIKSLYTNIPVNKCIKLSEIHLKKTNITLSLPVNKIIKICTFSTKLYFFLYNGISINKNLIYSSVCLPVESGEVLINLPFTQEKFSWHND